MNPNDPIAIVGVGCRFPGADNLDEFWRLLLNGENHVKEIPPERWSLDFYYDANPNTPNKTYVRRAGLIDRHDEWDNRFYGISASEAEQIDPQQRMVLDCVHMAMEDGGITKKQLNGTYTGVYIGIMNDDYRGAATGDGDHLDHYTLTGSSPSIASARVSYQYNLLGPAITVDTACSSALVSIHLAAQAIRTGDCEMAICGGVNSILYPEIFIPLSKARMVSPTGQCQAFSEKADGYARGEGCGVVIIKPLSKALSDGDNIWATLLTGCNQDGHTATPITAPSSLMQSELLKRVYSQNNINPSDIQYIEAHGTGTPTGDPVEANALGKFFAKTAKEEDYIRIGSVKTNIAHLESAAGSAGLIKVLLMMKNGKYVPSLHVEKFNPAINFDQYGLKLVQEVSNWEEPDNGPRMGCVNCFGFGGTNSHAVVKQYKQNYPDAKGDNQHEFVIAVSGEDLVALEKNSVHMIETLQKENLSLGWLSYTTTRRRDHYLYRTLFFSQSRDDMQKQIQDKLENLKEVTPALHKIPKIVYVFCGVGTTWQGMCKNLIKTVPVFSNAVMEIDGFLKPLTGWSIYEKLQNEDDVSDPFLGHLSIFTCQVALTAVWKHWGINPDAIVGQSVGEVAASYVSGALTLRDAVNVIYHRSLILAEEVGGGMMVVKNCEKSVLDEICCNLTCGKVSIAVHSSPVSSTVSGDIDAIDELKDVLEKRNSELAPDLRSLVILLKVRCAYHSHHMEKASIKVTESLSSVVAASPNVPVYSTVYAQSTCEGFGSAEYWGYNVKNPVLFHQALLNARADNNSTVYLEIGPKPVLKAHINDIFTDSNIYALPSMTSKDEVGTLYQTLKTLYGYGVDPSWANFVQDFHIPANLPKYQFNKSKILFESDKRKLKSEGREDPDPLVCRKPGNERSFKVNLNIEETPYVYDHFVQGSTIVPGALHGEIALELGLLVLECPASYVKASFQVTSLVAVNDRQSCKLDIETTTVDKNGSFQFVTRRNGNICSKGTLSLQGRQATTKVDIDTIMTHCNKNVSSDTLYGGLQKYGFEYGPLMRNVGHIHHSSTECLAEINVTDKLFKNLKSHVLHPAIIDAMWHSSLPLLSGLGEEGISEIDMPDEAGDEVLNEEDYEQVAARRANQQRREEHAGKRLFPVGPGCIMVTQQPQRHMYCYTVITQESDNAIFTNSLLLKPDGTVIAEMIDIEHRFVDNSVDVDSFSYEVAWQPTKITPSKADITENHNWLIISSKPKIIEHMQELLPGFSNAIFSGVDIGVQNQVALEVESFVNRSESMSGIIFVPGGHINNEEASPMEVVGFMRNSCLLLLKILNLFGKTTVPIIVITEGTQVHRLSETGRVNVIGSELWGLVRSVTKEAIDAPVTLIDVRHSILASSECLKDVIVKVAQRELDDYIEMSIDGEEIYTNEFINVTKQGRVTTFRNNVFDDKCQIELRSKQISKFKEPFYTIQDTEVFELTENNSIVSLEEVVIQDPSEHPVTEPGTTGEIVVWPEDEESGHKVVSLEVKGNTVLNKVPKEIKLSGSQITTDSLKTSQYCRKNNGSKKKEKKQKVLACYPISVASMVSIPNSCICRAKDLPYYVPGILKESVICWNLVTNIKKRTTVCIVTSTFHSSLVQMMKIMLESKLKRCTVSLVSESDLDSGSEIEAATVVLLSEKVLLDLNDILANSTLVKYLISIRTCLPLSQAREIVRKRPRLKIFNIEMSDIFDQQKLQKSFPRVRQWLKKNKKSLKRVKWNNNGNSVRISRESKSSSDPNIVKVPKEMLFRPDCAYLIIGALSGLGWELLQILAAMGAGTIITMSRRDLTEDMSQKLENIEQIFGVKIVHLQADVCNLLSLQRSFAQFSKLHPGVVIKGIFNGAGVIDDGPYTEMTVEKFEKAFLPKVLGTWNLHTVSKSIPLDYFVMHSSIASVLGNAGQSNYAAGNSFLDTMSHYRRSLGLAAQTINWGALTVGMAEDKLLQQYLASLGFLTLDVDDIRVCFIDSLITNQTQITYASFDWPTIAQVISTSNNKGVKSRLKTIIESKAKSGGGMSQGQMSADAIDLVEFNKLTIEEKFSKLMEIMAKVLAEILTVDEGIIAPETDVLELGLDSQRAMELISKLFSITYCRVPFVLIMSGENKVKDIVDYLIEHIPTGSEEEMAAAKVKENVKGTMTYMEHYYYSRYLKDPNDPSLTYIVDFQVSLTLSNPEIWRKVIQGMLGVYPELRVLHRPALDTKTRFHVRKFILPPEKAVLDFRIVKKEDLLLENGMPKNWSLCKFNPRTDLPIRVLYVPSGINHTVRLLCSNIFTDMASHWSLLGDIQRNLPSYMMYKKISSKPKPAIDVADLMEDTLQAELPLLEKFWDQQMEKCSDDIVTLSSDQKVHAFSNDCGLIKGPMPEDLFDSLKSYSASKNISPFHVITSLYQMILHRLTRQKAVPLSTVVDMRMHFPEFAPRILNARNNIALVAEFHDSDESLDDYITRNSKIIRKSIFHGMYPFKLLSDRHENIAAMLRHRVVFDDYSRAPKQPENKYKGFWMKMKNTIGGDYATETKLVMQDYKDSLKLEFQYDRQSVDKDLATRMVDCLYYLIEHVLEAPEKSSSSMFPGGKLPITFNQQSERNTQSKVAATFMKQTKHGWDHEVQLSLQYYKENEATYQRLAWKRTQGKEATRLLPVSMITDIHSVHINGIPSLLIQTMERKFIFKSVDANLVATWLQDLKNIINKNKQNNNMVICEINKHSTKL